MRRNRKKKRIRAKPLTRIIFILALLWTFFAFCESRVRLLPASVAELAGKTFAQEQINAVMEKHISKWDNGYEFTFDKNQKVSLLNTNAPAISLLKAQVSRELNEKLNGSCTVYIPIGNLLHIRLLNGYGFPVPVRLYYRGTANVELKSEIASAGVNQSKFRLTAEIRAELYSHSVTSASKITATGDYLLCETVILGDVPTFAPNSSK